MKISGKISHTKSIQVLQAQDMQQMPPTAPKITTGTLCKKKIH